MNLAWRLPVRMRTFTRQRGRLAVGAKAGPVDVVDLTEKIWSASSPLLSRIRAPSRVAFSRRRNLAKSKMTPTLPCSLPCAYWRQMCSEFSSEKFAYEVARVGVRLIEIRAPTQEPEAVD